MRNDEKQHFSVVRPRATHFQRATCKETECDQFVKGWRTVVPMNGPQADYLRHDSRRFVEKRVGTMAVFIYYPGQEFFDSLQHRHWKPLDRMPILLHQARPGARRRIRELDEFTDTQNEEVYQINAAKSRG